MKKIYSKKPITIIWLFSIILILLGVNSCSCFNPSIPNNPTEGAEPNTNQETQPSTKKIWHTEQHSDKDQVKPAQDPYSNTNQSSFYNRIYEVYRVEHTGQQLRCGYRSFIPILLETILVDNKWKPWLENLHNTLYKPAQPKIDQVWPVNQTHKVTIRTTNNLDKLYKDTEGLLQKLANEASPRKLEVPEIELLVDFLRQLVIMQKVLSEYPKVTFTSNKLTAFKAKIEKSITDDKLLVAPDNFMIFNIPYMVMLRNHNLVYYDKKKKHTAISSSAFKTKDVPQSTFIMLYQGDQGHFDYIIAKEN